MIMAKHGICVPYDLTEPIKALSDADKGRMMEAILEYGQSGNLPQFDGALALAWEFIKIEIDRTNGIASPAHKK